MRSRNLSFLIALVAAFLFLSGPASPGEKDHHDGTVVKAGKGKLAMTFKGETKEHTHDVAPKAKITLDGQKARLEDLKAGYHVHVHMNAKHVVTSIRAHSKEKKE